MREKAGILENAKILNDMGILPPGKNKISAIQQVCKESPIGSHRCNVKTRFGWCCDLCIEPELLELHNLGVHTINSCCGHGNNENACILVIGKESIKKMVSMGYQESANQVEDPEYRSKMVSYTPKTVFAYQYVPALSERSGEDG